MSLISVNNLTFGYDGSLKNIFENVSFNIDTDWKLGLIGRNGKGKTTFLKLLLGKYEYQGAISKNVEFDYFPFEVKNKERMAIEIVNEIAPNVEDWEIIRELNLLNTDTEVLYRSFNLLSGGEQIKILLISLFLKGNNFLLIDEPTNHLDIINKDNIEKMLTDYQGTVIVVSHDRYLIKEVCNKLLVLSNGESSLYKYGYSEYEEKKRELGPEKNVENVKVKKVVSYNIKKEINRIENDIVKLEGKLKNLNDELSRKEVYTDKKKYNDVQKEIDAITSEIDNKTIMWDNLTKIFSCVIFFILFSCYQSIFFRNSSVLYLS